MHGGGAGLTGVDKSDPVLVSSYELLVTAVEVENGDADEELVAILLTIR